MKIGLHISDFTYPNGPAGLADDLTRIAVAAEEEGFARLSVMDHVWQIPGPFEGTHYRLERTLNVPGPLSRPHPPILIGGSGEKKTLRLVAQYAQACNLYGGPEVGRKLEVLRGHCDAVGRDYDDIEKTVIGPLDPADPEALLTQLRAYADLGITQYHGSVAGVSEIEPLRVLGREVIPAAAEL